MKTLTLDIPSSGLHLKLAAPGMSATQVVLVVPDNVTILELTTGRSDGASKSAPLREGERPVRTIATENGFPHVS